MRGDAHVRFGGAGWGDDRPRWTAPHPGPTLTWFSLLPSVRATWAPKGQTPVLHHRFNWKRLSMSAALCFRPDGTEASPRIRHTARGLQRPITHRVPHGASPPP